MVWSVWFVLHFNVRLFNDAIQIFMQQIQNVVHQLSGVLLTVTLESADLAAKSSL